MLTWQERPNALLWGNTTQTILRIPDIAVVGTIPYRSSVLHQLPPEFENSKFEISPKDFYRRGALSMLFESGDRKVPTILDFETFKNAARSDYYRGAIWLRDIHLYLDDKKELCGLQTTWGRAYGATPFRLSYFNPQWSPNIAHPMQGEERPTMPLVTVGIDPGLVTLTFRYEFRLGKRADVMQTFMTKRPAPWVWMDLAIYFDIHAGATQAQLMYTGSSMPGYHIMLDGRPIIAHDMTTLDSQAIDAFLESNPSIGRLRILSKDFSVARSKAKNAPAHSIEALGHFLPIRHG